MPPLFMTRFRWTGMGAVAILVMIAMLLGIRAYGAVAPDSEPGWIYLRDGLRPAANEQLVAILAVGDVMPGRGMAQVRDVLAEVTAELRSADLTIGNLEGAVWGEAASDAGISLLLPPGAPESLAEAGFDLLSLANNHSLDGGVTGLVATRRQLRLVGIEPIEADQPVLRAIGGSTFAFVAWNDLGSPPEEDVLAAVRQASASADHVIVQVHWGREYARQPGLPQRELAASLLDAGADIVLGSHPHVVQEVWIVEPAAAMEGSRLVAYSLGNFAFDQGWGDTRQGLALRLLFDGQGLRAAQALPLWTAPRPQWMNADDSAALLDRILPAQRTGFACSKESCWAIPASETSRRGAFFSGAIDLTGDGVNEIVRRTDGEVQILDAREVVWRSPPEWEVVDLALGDPNDDGRFEAILAIERTAAGGKTVSQPFVIGYRGGTYHDLWGGSPVHAPVLEVELGDVDGDGAEELIVLEASPDRPERYVSVWRWHGWGFSLVWRSPPGSYRDLILVPAPGGKQDVAVYP